MFSEIKRDFFRNFVDIRGGGAGGKYRVAITCFLLERGTL